MIDTNSLKELYERLSHATLLSSNDKSLLDHLTQQFPSSQPNRLLTNDELYKLLGLLIHLPKEIETENTKNIFRAILILKSAQLFSQENFKIILKFKNPQEVASLLWQLNINSILSQANIRLVLKAYDKDLAMNLLLFFKELHINDTNLIETVLNHPKNSLFIIILENLEKNKNLITYENLKNIVKYFQFVEEILEFSKRPNINQEQFDHMIRSFRSQLSIAFLTGSHKRGAQGTPVLKFFSTTYSPHTNEVSEAYTVQNQRDLFLIIKKYI